MKRSVLFGVFLALVVVAVAFAQGKPNFSGKWTPEQAAAGGSGRGGGGPMTVTQDDKTLTVEREGRQGTQKTVYNLDGTPTTAETQMGKSTSTAKWDGSKLVITTKMETEQGRGRGMGGGPMTVTQDDKTLTVERTMGQAGTMKSVYNLDGTESKNEMSRGGQTMTSTSTCKWDGSKLVITTKSEGPNGPMERVQTWSLTADGKLQIEQPGQGGQTRTTTYTKG